MSTQSEQVLENNLIKQLSGLGYERVDITSSDDLIQNLKTQLEKHNATTFTQGEFEKILNHLNKGNVFDRAKTLRDKFELLRDDGTVIYIEFFNKAKWCQNQYQVTNQVTIKGTYENRYDVTLLVNGLPLVQIELKRRGLEIKEAFNQVNRYQRHSYGAEYGLFNYVQLFVISNGVNTKYYANNRKQSFKQTFYWADKDNELITDLTQFADDFLEKCHVSKMIAQYIVLHESDKILMVLRPYQYYAVEAIVNQVQHGRKNGYIWHTTGSGKTLTSFKAAQILQSWPKVDKVVFVVDRADLDYQTTKEFNHFSEGSVDGTDNTRKLVDQFTDGTKLIVTTIQKLNTAIQKQQYLQKMESQKDKRIVFIFDECHRSQFGETHQRITEFFTSHQMFGFTGTPIFKENSVRNQLGRKTTRDLFGDRLHNYLITNAIKDGNVLKFSIEYWGKFKLKDGTILNEMVEGINTKEVFEDEGYITKNIDWIIENHNRKTHNKAFSAMMCVGSVDALIKYYEIFKAKKEAGKHDLRIGTIFTYGANEEDKDANGLIDDPDFDINLDAPAHKHTREKLDEYIADYNAMYKTSFSTKDSKSFYNYYKDIAKRMKEREKETFKDKDRLDILLVVNMYLTGFDAKKLNTLYVDKNLKFHGLIQAFSRTNRILNEVKSHGNIVCFRNLKKATDEAIALFSDKDANETIIMEPYETYIEQFQEALDTLKSITPNVDSVNSLESEKDVLSFIKAFRAIIRLKNILGGFSEFKFDDLGITEQEFEDYKSKYLDIHDEHKSEKAETTSIVNEVDFELELIQRDEVNVTYILKLLADMHYDSNNTKVSKPDVEKKKKAIIDLLGSEAKLRSKRELIEKFIAENMPHVKSAEDIEEHFKAFWDEERFKAIEKLCKEENLKGEELKEVVEQYMFTRQKPLSGSIVKSLKEKPTILERRSIIERVSEKIISLITLFDDAMDV